MLVQEGDEDAPFWNALGGEEEYYKGPADKVKEQTTLFDLVCI